MKRFLMGLVLVVGMGSVPSSRVVVAQDLMGQDSAFQGHLLQAEEEAPEEERRVKFDSAILRGASDDLDRAGLWAEAMAPNHQAGVWQSGRKVVVAFKGDPEIWRKGLSAVVKHPERLKLVRVQRSGIDPTKNRVTAGVENLTASFKRRVFQRFGRDVQVVVGHPFVLL